MKDPKDYPDRVRVWWWRPRGGWVPGWWVRTVERGRKAGSYVILIRKLDKELSAKHDASDISKWFKWVERVVAPNSVQEHKEPSGWPKKTPK